MQKFLLTRTITEMGRMSAEDTALQLDDGNDSVDMHPDDDPAPEQGKSRLSKNELGFSCIILHVPRSADSAILIIRRILPSPIPTLSISMTLTSQIILSWCLRIVFICPYFI